MGSLEKLPLRIAAFNQAFGRALVDAFWTYPRLWTFLIGVAIIMD